jgi:tetratricopeptide (TPR) repeat protein
MGLVHKAAAEKASKDGNSAKAADEQRLQAIALDAAMKEVNVALECDYNFVGAWQTRSEILAAQNKPEETVACYERIIQIDPLIEGVRALNHLMLFYDQKKDKERDKQIACLDKAATQFSQAVAGKPPSAEFIRMPFFLANAYGNLKETEKAIHWLQTTGECVHGLFGKAPNSPDAAIIWFQIAAKYIELKRPDEALAWLNEMPNINGMQAALLNARGAAYELKGDYQQAKAYFEQALRLAPEATDVQQNLKRVNERLLKLP